MLSNFTKCSTNACYDIMARSGGVAIFHVYVQFRERRHFYTQTITLADRAYTHRDSPGAAPARRVMSAIALFSRNQYKRSTHRQQNGV